MSLKFVKKFFSTHTHIKIAIIFLLVTLIAFIFRIKAYDGAWSDEVFIAEVVGLFVTNVILVIFNKHLPTPKIILPWLLATIAVSILFAYFYVSYSHGLYPVSFGELFFSFEQYTTVRLQFFGLFKYGA